MVKEQKKRKEVFLKELAEAKMDNAVDKFELSRYWYFQKRIIKELEPDIPA